MAKSESSVYEDPLFIPAKPEEKLLRFTDCEFRAGVAWSEHTYDCEFEFVDCTFFGDFRVTKIEFNGRLTFNRCKFVSVDSDLIGSVVDFRDVDFQSDLLFLGATRFTSKVYFDGCQFQKGITIEGAKFERKIAFSRCIVSSSVDFLNCVFNSSVSCFGLAAEFTSNIDFLRLDLSEFHGPAEFGSMDIAGGFSAVECKFFKSVNFGGSFFGGIFDLTRSTFKLVPNFLQTRFEVDPDISKTEFAFYVNPDDFEVSLEERYRALKRISIASENHSRELEFFDFEIRCRTASAQTSGFWERLADLGYLGVSSSGRSVSKPLLGLFLNFVLGVILVYLISLWGNGRSLAMPCTEVERFASAALFSMRSVAFIFGDFFFSGQDEIYRCIVSGNVNNLPTSALKFPVLLYAWLLSFLSIFQGLASIILVFLLTLGLRNRYRIL